MLPFVPGKIAGCKPDPADTTLPRGWVQHVGFLVLCLSSAQYRLHVLHCVSFPLCFSLLWVIQVALVAS